MEYRKEIDGLRALAVLPVILFHAGFETFSGGFVGVDVFFVISGYLITTIILAELEGDKFSITNFYERRARRILPALFFIMLTCVIFAWFWLLPSDMKSFSQSLITVSIFSSNIFFWRESGYFEAAAELKPLLHTWSLAVEEQYYILFPVFLLLAWRFGKHLVIILLALAAILSITLAQWGTIENPGAAFYLLPTRAWELLIGSLIAFYLAKDNRLGLNKTLSEMAGASGVTLILYSVLNYNKQTPFPGVFALAPIAGAALIILFATKQTIIGKVIGSKIFVYIGLISYSAYLWHQPLFAFARYKNADDLSSWILVTLCIFSFILAYFSWRYIEIPFRNRKKYSRRKIFTYGFFGSVLLAVFGLIGSLSDGFLYRYKSEDQYLAGLRPSEAGEYVQNRFNKLLNKEFETDNKRLRVLIIGDSYGQDLVNALYEVGFAKNIQLSTHHISHRCGNLFLNRNELIPKIAQEDKTLCNKPGLFEDEHVRKLMLSADEIWFSSAWQLWQAELITKSMSNMRNYINKPVKIFGRKNFGNVNIKKLLKLSEAERINYRGIVEVNTLEINAILKNNLPLDVFIDTQSLVCGEATNTCAQFLNDGSLISYDGGHLTKSGAEFYGQKLVQSGLIRTFIQPN